MQPPSGQAGSPTGTANVAIRSKGVLFTMLKTGRNTVFANVLGCYAEYDEIFGGDEAHVGLELRVRHPLQRYIMITHTVYEIAKALPLGKPSDLR
jgi:hypothetical protein